ncbi:hypothetical protein [Cellulomonas aerilata]|uniref:Uncharacterized protein n=1 Tax=Cellulomonas aerilata TaxID=515326 RepID=A0A512DAA4_9CELL|nr:hypothetical protein [Cellulomonas aerilata]GEO33385.1 hypothetical protein CAE01nite_11100 [Cellulomonas aerilata]
MVQRLHARRAVGAAAAAAALVLTGGVAGTASAEPPTREASPSGLPATFPAGAACSFPVEIEEAEPAGLEEVDFGEGRTVVLGPFVVRLTNKETGRSVVRDISGPITNKGARSTAFGATVTPIFAGNDPDDLLPGGEPGLFFVQGVVVFENFVLTRLTGQVEDLCAVLAGPGA